MSNFKMRERKKKNRVYCERWKEVEKIELNKIRIGSETGLSDRVQSQSKREEEK